ncbi:MAG: hypothetical protein AVDCRST_MAG50-1624, partial [uncultured Acidimicrobiales bacterium]
AGCHQVIRPGHGRGVDRSRHRPLRVRPRTRCPRRIDLPDAAPRPARRVRRDREGAGDPAAPRLGGRHGHAAHAPRRVGL